jgi:SAM-dependent methyltransferase
MDDTVSAAPAAAGTVGEQTFDAYYFAHCCGAPYKRDAHWLGFFGAIADRIVAQIQPRRVLDAGCALGILVETLRDRGVDAEGIDLSSYAIANVHEPIKPFCRQGSIADEFPERYDLIVSIEVLEHMPARDGEAAIANFCRHTDDVLFSSTPNDHRELSHVNVQPGEYWAELFAQHGFYRDVDFDASFLTPWAVRFRRGRDPLPRIVRNYERQYAALAATRNDARTFSTELQRDLAQALARVTALEADVAASAQARADLKLLADHLHNLAAALAQERSAAEQRLEEIGRVRESLAAERAEVARRAAEENREIAALRESIEQSHVNLTRKVIELDAAGQRAAELQAQAAVLEHDLAHARQTIQLMEQSVFWRIRRLWVPIARALGRST